MRFSLERQNVLKGLRVILTDTRVWLSFIIVGFVAHTLMFGTYLSDDALISLSYSRNLAQGHGFVLTPQSEYVEGFSNFAWVILLTLPYWLGLGDLHPIWLLKPVGISLGVATLLLVYRLPIIAYRVRDNDPLLLFAPLALSISVPFTHWTVAGLENPLYSFLIVLSVSLYLYELHDPTRRPWSAVALLLTALTRPEGIIFSGVVFIHKGLFLLWHRQFPTRRDLLWGSIIFGGYGVFLLWRYSYFGYWVPNTFYAKVGDKRSLLTALFNVNDSGWRYILSFIWHQGIVFLYP